MESIMRWKHIIAGACLLPVSIGLADPVAVRYAEGLVHGFLALKTLDGKTIADGELSQIVRGDRVTGHVTFHFRDGSLYDDVVTFSQRGTFRLLTDHLVQKGPSFPEPMDILVDTSKGEVTVRYKEKDGTAKVLTEKRELKPDTANGLVLTLLKDIQPTAAETSVSMVVATPKTRMVTLEIRPLGEEPFSIGALRKKAMHYVVKVKIGGVAGAIAPIVGKQPPDIHVWIAGGEEPSFVKSEGPLFEGGPIWRTELANAAIFEGAPAKRSN
jgi:hypothetical protein